MGDTLTTLNSFIAYLYICIKSKREPQTVLIAEKEGKQGVK